MVFPAGLFRKIRTAFGDLKADHSVLLRYSIATTVVGVVGMLAGFIILRWIAPEQMGLWNSLLLVQTYASFVQLGVFNGLNRELPFRLGRGDKTAVELVSTAQSFSLVVTGLLIVGAIASLFVSANPNVRFVLPAVFITSASSFYQQFLGATYRASRAFQKLTIINFIDAGAAVATLPLVYFLGYPGLPIRAVVLALLAAGTRHLWRPYKVKTRFRPDLLGVLLKVGVPLYGFGYVLVTAESFPRVVLLSQGDLEMVGLFSPASAMITLMVLVPQAIGSYVYPHMTYKLGQTGDPRSIWSAAWKSAMGSMALAVPILIVAFFAIPPLIKLFLPEYVNSINSVKWTLLAGIFLGSSIATNALNSLKAWGLMSVYVATRAATSFLLPLLFFYTFTDHVEGVAFGYAICQALCFCVGMLCVHRATVGVGKRGAALA